MYGLASVSLCLLLLVNIAPQYECNPFFWYFPRIPSTTNNNRSGTNAAANTSADQSSNVSIAVGNRINTNTTLDDYGTRIDGLTVNVARRRRRRDLWDIPSSIPAIPNIIGDSSLPNGSYVAIGNQVFQLPDQLSNLSLNIVSSSGPQSAPQGLNVAASFLPTIPDNYTDAFQALVTQFQTLSLDTLDVIVENLSAGYARLNKSLEYGRAIVQVGLSDLADQGARGFEQFIKTFNSSTSRVQRCIGTNLNPSNVARTVVGQGNECINSKWRELSELVGNIKDDIVAADHGAMQFLTNLTICNGTNFGGPNAQRNSLRRWCYVQTVQSFPQSLLFLPVGLTIDTAELYASLESLQTDMAVCGSQVALQIAIVSTQIGSKIILCQAFPS